MHALFNVASKKCTTCLFDHFVYRHTAISPWMPWVMERSYFANMGISLSSCTISNEIIKDSTIGSSFQVTRRLQRRNPYERADVLAEC